MMTTSVPPTQPETDALKVDIKRRPSSYSFHSISGSPTNTDEINDSHDELAQDGRRRSASYPATPPIPDGTSYPASPNDILSGSKGGITPICTSPLAGAEAEAESEAEADENSIFPDTIKIELPEIDEKEASFPLNKNKKKSQEEETLLSHGYKRSKYIADTLQGQTFLASHCDLGEVVIKKTRKDLYARGITISKEGKAFNIKEDIVFEAQMMQKFQVNSPPASLIKFYEFFEDCDDYYLVMENGGRDFFDFVVHCHELISCGKLRMKEWRKQCKFMFAQMVECIEWLHNEMNYCHLDISLENILISNEVQFDEESGTLSKCYIKFIDFGLAESFNLARNPSFLCKKFVGKTHYKSPKVYAKKEEFCANLADVWSLGVCLFMMIIGAPPYNKPYSKDAGFRFIRNKKITKLLYSWNRIKYVTPNLYDLIERMLCCEETERITIDDIIAHDWCKIYFPHKKKQQKQDQLKTPPRISVNTGNLPMSPSMSTSCSNSYSTININGAQINSMVPQHAVSMTPRTPRTPRSTTPTTAAAAAAAARKASSSYPYPRIHKNSYSNKRNSTAAAAQRTPTPIITESQTSVNDNPQYFAALDASDAENNNKPKKNSKKKKKKKKFFKLSLSIFKK